MALLFDELPVPFPFYTDKERQVRFNVNSDEPCGASLISPKDTVLPFQIRKAISSELPRVFEIRKAIDDTVVADCGNWILANTVGESLEGYDYLTYKADVPMKINSGTGYGATLDLNPGEYYVKMTFPGGEILYSECFHVPLERFSISDLSDCPFLCLEWSDSKDIAPLHYAGYVPFRFVNRVFLDSNIYNSEPEIEQEGTKNGDNELLPTFQKVSVKYKIEDVVPDFLKLALSTIPIHANITLTTEYAKRTGQIENVTVVSKPEANGYFSEVSIKFEQNLALIKRGCGDFMAATPCPSVPVGWNFHLAVTTGLNEISVYAELPPGFTANIRNRFTGGTKTVRTNVSRGALFSFVVIPFHELPGDSIDLEITTFNCVSATTAPVSITGLTYHPMVQEFLYVIEHDAAFIGVGGSISSGHKSALNVLHATMWQKGIGARTWACWPVIGSIMYSQKYNLYMPADTNAAHRLTFPFGATWGANGIALARSSGQYVDSWFDIDAEKGNTMSATMVMDIQSIATVTDYGICGRLQSASRTFAMEVIGSGTQFEGVSYGNGLGDTVAEPFGPGQAARYYLSRTATDKLTFYFNGFPDVVNTNPQNGAAPAGNIYFGGINGSLGLGTLDGTIDFMALVAGLTDQEVADFDAAIVVYKTALGR